MPIAFMYLVFHRILDLKTGLDFYPGPFFLTSQPFNLSPFMRIALSAIQPCWAAIWLTFFYGLFFFRLFIYLNSRDEDTLYAPGSGYPLGGPGEKHIPGTLPPSLPLTPQRSMYL